MTIKEAIFIALKELEGARNYTDITNHIISNKHYDFGEAKTPHHTVSAQLGDLIRLGDTRIKRVKKGNGYFYYLTSKEQDVNIEDILSENKPEKTQVKTNKSFHERDLHLLLSTYLKSSDTYSKTIFHEQSYTKDSNQIWTHPDMVGVKLLKLQSKSSQNFLKSINKIDTFKLSSYEIKKEINSDSELKKAFFQAVSNSSWANFGYLVSFEINDTLYDEMYRLNQSFGIGIIKLNANPYQSKVLFNAAYRDLDFKTIDKLCKLNKDFEKFIEQVEKLLTAADKYQKSTEKELEEFCDEYLITDSDIEHYCNEKNIPLNEEDL
ncbi:MAG: hypothetical protein ACOYEG_02480 [Petrimonas sp.]|jgi:hypothetical protein|nr:MAG: hypothetical protein BWZ00_01102 [Bacteroidetes bacterium ADurb.BinA174]